MFTGKVVNNFEVYSDPYRDTQVGQKRKHFDGDRTVPNRSWSLNQGSFNFDAAGTVTKAVRAAFDLERSDRVLKFNNTLPTLLKREEVVKIWELTPFQRLDAPDVVDDFYNKPLSVDGSQQNFVIALANKVFSSKEGTPSLYSANSNITWVNYNRDSTKVCALEYQTSAVSVFDASIPVGRSSTPRFVTYRSTTDCISTFSLTGDSLYAGTYKGSLLQGDMRQRFLSRARSAIRERIINIAFSRFNEHLVAISADQSLLLHDLRNLNVPLKSYPIPSPIAVDFEPTGKSQLIVGSGSIDTHLRKIFYEADFSLENIPKIMLGKQVTSVRWISEKTVFVATGSSGPVSQKEPAVKVIRVLEDSLKIAGVKAPANTSEMENQNERVLQVERMGDTMLALSNREILYYLPLQDILKQETVKDQKTSALENVIR